MMFRHCRKCKHSNLSVRRWSYICFRRSPQGVSGHVYVHGWAAKFCSTYEYSPKKNIKVSYVKPNLWQKFKQFIFRLTDSHWE